MRSYCKDKLFQELDWETLRQRQWYRKLCCFYEILKLKLPIYVHKLVPVPSRSCRARQCDKIPLFNVHHNLFRNTFFSLSTIEWNNLYTVITDSKSIGAFLKRLSAFIRSTQSFTFNHHNP